MKSFLKDLIIAVFIAVVIIQFIKPTIIKESSMQPTLYENDYIFLSKQAYNLFGDPEYGDIIVFHSDIESENGKKKDLIKRIIGLPGDVISVTDGVVFRNDEVLKESYTMEDYTTGQVMEYEVPDGMMFVMGDNRRVSLDSRSEDIGAVSMDDIMGKAVWKVYPFKDFGKI
ncbi:MAG: signal peptidase I [Anaerovoracaceae bacterium]|nr:signal peptidase I [Anaerovoracaceae bacterium]